MKRKHLGVLLSFILLFALCFPSLSFAHANLLDSTPKQGQTVEQPPKTIELHFSEQVQADLVTIQITNSTAQNIPAAVQLAPTDPTRVIVTLPSIGKGTYTIHWSVLSEDGHPVQGIYSFAYGQKIATTSGAIHASNTLATFLLIMLRFLSEGWILLSAGFIWISYFASKRGLPSVTWFPSSQTKWITVIGWLAVQVSIWLLYASQLPQNLPTKWLISGQWDLLLQVPFALVLLVQVPLFALLLIPNMVSGWYLGLWGLLTASFAFSGHTWSSTNHLLSLFARFLHLASGALWLGGIVYLLIIVWKQQKKLFDLIKQFRTFFSKTALTASILLIASGLLLAGTQTDWSAILSFHTFWSRFLLIKICLVFGMLIYAFFQTRQWKTVGTLEKDSLRTEWILGLLALLLGIWMSQIAYPILPS